MTAHQLNIDAAQREIDQRSAEGEDMSLAYIAENYSIIKPVSVPLEWSALWAAMKAAPDAWIPTTQAMYWEMFECLPPRQHSLCAFLVGEPERHNEQGQPVYACFKQAGESYAARYLTVAEFRQVFY